MNKNKVLFGDEDSYGIVGWTLMILLYVVFNSLTGWSLAPLLISSFILYAQLPSL